MPNGFIIIPGLAVFCTHLFSIIKFAMEEITDGQAGLIMLFWPIGELISLVVGFFIGYLVELIIKRIKTSLGQIKYLII
jgi:NhaP-type Na+/H+ or K+/H+ antiporter